MKKIRACALALTFLAGLTVMAPSARAAGPLIQPGERMQSASGLCTFNFIYDGTGTKAGKVYAGTAAHCVNAVGEDIKLTNGQVVGDVAVIGNENSTVADWALVEVRSAFLSQVSAAMKGHPQYPTGSTVSQETFTGDNVQLSGYGVPFYVTRQTRESRVAVLTGDNAEMHSVVGPLLWGDSGGPLVHVRTGKALGIVSRLCFGACTEMGPTVEGILAKAAAKGFTVTLRTV